jgi:hypothetical protein
VNDAVRIGEHLGKCGIRDVLIQDPVHLALPHRDLLRATRHEIEQTIASSADRPGHAAFEQGDMANRPLLGQTPPEDISHILQRLGGKEEVPSNGLLAIGAYHEVKLGRVTIREVH